VETAPAGMVERETSGGRDISPEKSQCARDAVAM
jgi:hypothetical protein